MLPAIARIAARHVETHIRPEHYPAVANALLPAIQDVLGEAVDDAALQAWGEVELTADGRFFVAFWRQQPSEAAALCRHEELVERENRTLAAGAAGTK